MSISCPVISVKEMQLWEKASWEIGINEEHVIRLVGKAIAEWIVRNIDPGSRILMIIGKGNNGADVKAAQQFLPTKDFEIKGVKIDDPQNALTDVLESLAVPIQTLSQYEESPDIAFEEASWIPDLVVDGLFGIGLRGGLEGHWQKLVDFLNLLNPILSIDCPSGIDCDTGQVVSTAIKATWTMTVGAPKTGLVLPVAAPHTGRLLLAHDVGLHPELPLNPSLRTMDADIQWVWNKGITDVSGEVIREVEGHKGDYGHMVEIAGSPGYHGAAILAAKAAQSRQPGLISVLTIGDAFIPVASNLLGPMVHKFSNQSLEELMDKATSILIGPGLATSEARNYVYPVLQDLWKHSEKTLIVDATALDWLPVGKVSTNSLRVITPHAGEAKRMLAKAHIENIDPQVDRFAAAKKLSETYGGCVTVLKGYLTQTYIDGTHFLNPTGNPSLAQGGAGDVLSGMIAGNLAHPYKGWDQNEILNEQKIMVLRAIWHHGAAADTLQSDAMHWTIEDVVEKIKVPAAFQFMMSPD